MLYFFSLKRLNYERSDYNHFLDTIEDSPAGTLFLFDGFDQLRSEETTIDNARKCIYQASKVGSVIVTSRSKVCDSKIQVSFELVETLSITDAQICAFLSPVCSSTAKYQSIDLMHNTMFLSIARELLAHDPNVNLVELNESRLIDLYFRRLYCESGSEHESKEGRVKQYERDIKSIGESLYRDVARKARYQKLRFEEHLELEPFGKIPQILNDIFCEQFGGIDADQSKYLDFALAKYVFTLIDIDREQHGNESDAFYAQLKYRFTTMGIPDMFFAYYDAGQLCAMNGKTIGLASRIIRGNFPISVGAVLFCLGQDICVFDDFFEMNQWGRKFLNRQGVYATFINDRFDIIKMQVGAANDPMYFGMCKKCVPDGIGIMYWAPGHLYEGDWKDGQMHGHGTMFWPDGSKYVGEWVTGKKHGAGNYTKGTYCYDGNWKNDLKEGEGCETYPDGSQIFGFWENGALYKGKLVRYNLVYDGYWKDNYYEGHGVLTYTDGTSYDCEWKHGLQHGKHGKMTFGDGLEWYEGGWVNGLYEGNGVWFSEKEGYMYQGKWLKGQKNGEGRYTSLLEDVVFEGQWENDVRHGYGKAWLPNGDVLEGNWEGELFTGTAILHYSNDEWYEGDFYRGMRHGSGCMHYKDGTEEIGEWRYDFFVRG